MEFGSFCGYLTNKLVLTGIHERKSRKDLPNLLNLLFNDSSFNKLKELRIEGLSQLSNITIGSNCFGSAKSVVFQCNDCALLTNSTSSSSNAAYWKRLFPELQVDDTE